MSKSIFFKCNSVCTIFLFFSTSITLAQCSPDFGAASSYAIFSSSGAISNVSLSNVNGDIGTDTGAISGFGTPTVLNGNIHIADAQTAAVSADLVAAYNLLVAAVATNSTHAPAFGGGETLVAGVYSTGGAGSVAGNLMLDAQGNPDAVFIFKIGGAFTTGAGTTIILTNGTSISNVFWIADGAIAMAANTTICGTLISNNGAVSMGDQGIIKGRLYTTSGAISIYGTSLDLFGVDTKAVGGNAIADQNINYGETPADIKLIQSSGTIVKWQKASDNVFSAPIDIANTSTTLSSAAIGSILETTYFRAVVKKLGCAMTTAYSSPCTITIISTTWNGTTWSNGLPVATKAVFITNDFTSIADFSALSLDVSNGANVIVQSGNAMTLNGKLTVANGSSFTIQTDANLIQTTNSQNIGAITIQKDTAALKRLDYVLWSSPVSGQLLLPFSPATLPNRFYNYNAASNYYAVIVSPATTSFSMGNANLIRMPNDHPSTPTVWQGTFYGVPNNGDVNLTVTSGTYNAIGNPYPSGVNADAFMAANNITEALYLWRKSNNPNNTSYAVYTTAGGTSNSQGDPLHLAPGSIIPIGQGFIAKATSAAIFFNNAMRTPAVNVPLLKSIASKSRVWLDLSSADGYFSQTLIAYMATATLGIDDAIDGRFFNDSQTALTSTINGELFSIQGRPLPFASDDVVPLGFQSELDNTFTIALDHFDGLFSQGQEVFLKDNYTQLYTNLKTGSYTFSTLAGVFNNRFEVVYQNTLGNNTQIPVNNKVIVYQNKSNLIISSGVIAITNVKVYDSAGRLITEKANLNNGEVVIPINESNQLLLVVITTINGDIVTKKVRV